MQVKVEDIQLRDEIQQKVYNLSTNKLKNEFNSSV